MLTGQQQIHSQHCWDPWSTQWFLEPSNLVSRKPLVVKQRQVLLNYIICKHSEKLLFKGAHKNSPFSLCPGSIWTEKPKSVSLIFTSSSNRMFSGFRSRWTILWVWRYSTTSRRARIIFLSKSEKRKLRANNQDVTFKIDTAAAMNGLELLYKYISLINFKYEIFMLKTSEHNVRYQMSGVSIIFFKVFTRSLLNFLNGSIWGNS